MIRSGHDFARVEFVGYLLGAVAIPPVAFVWAWGEKSRAGAFVIALGFLITPVMICGSNRSGQVPLAENAEPPRPCIYRTRIRPCARGGLRCCSRSPRLHAPLSGGPTTGSTKHPLAYLLSAFAAIVYIVAATSLSRSGHRSRRVAGVAISVGLVGVLVGWVRRKRVCSLMPSPPQRCGRGSEAATGSYPLVLPFVRVVVAATADDLCQSSVETIGEPARMGMLTHG